MIDSCHTAKKGMLEDFLSIFIRVHYCTLIPDPATLHFTIVAATNLGLRAKGKCAWKSTNTRMNSPFCKKGPTLLLLNHFSFLCYFSLRECALMSSNCYRRHTKLCLLFFDRCESAFSASVCLLVHFLHWIWDLFLYTDKSIRDHELILIRNPSIWFICSEGTWASLRADLSCMLLLRLFDFDVCLMVACCITAQRLFVRKIFLAHVLTKLSLLFFCLFQF